MFTKYIYKQQDDFNPNKHHLRLEKVIKWVRPTVCIVCYRPTVYRLYYTYDNEYDIYIYTYDIYNEMIIVPTRIIDLSKYYQIGHCALIFQKHYVSNSTRR